VPIDYTIASRTLTEALGLAQAPVAVCLTNSLPAGIAPFEGRLAAGCRFWQEGARRTIATAPRDHAGCAVGVYTHNLEQNAAVAEDLGDALGVFGQLGYVRPEDLAVIPVLKDRPAHVVYAPLAETPQAPDVVLLMVNANQTLILAEATQQIEGSWAPALGRPACAIVPQASNTGRTALSLGCCGARAYLDVLTPDVALYAIPGGKLEAFVERIEALAKANAVLTQFHSLRRQDFEGGAAPTIKQSLARLQG
jgi:uncharacterized protein (DUF169 family)